MYKQQVKWDLAKEMYTFVLEKRRLLLGDTHPSTLNSLNTLVMIHVHEDNYEFAEPLCVELKKSLGQDHFYQDIQSKEFIP
jgi:hypothetical protein